MLSGKIQKIRKDHRAWLDQIDHFLTEISQLKNTLPSRNGNSRFINDLLHHERILEKLRTSINSHRLFIDEIAGDPGITLEFLDLEGHERNHQHLLNVELSFRKLLHEAPGTPDHETALS